MKRISLFVRFVRIERDFEAAEGSERVGFSHGDFGFVVQTLDHRQ